MLQGTFGSSERLMCRPVIEELQAADVCAPAQRASMPGSVSVRIFARKRFDVHVPDQPRRDGVQLPVISGGRQAKARDVSGYVLSGLPCRLGTGQRSIGGDLTRGITLFRRWLVWPLFRRSWGSQSAEVLSGRLASQIQSST